jgi:hypothetical protein
MDRAKRTSIWDSSLWKLSPIFFNFNGPLAVRELYAKFVSSYSSFEDLNNMSRVNSVAKQQPVAKHMHELTDFMPAGALIVGRSPFEHIHVCLPPDC